MKLLTLIAIACMSVSSVAYAAKPLKNRSKEMKHEFKKCEGLVKHYVELGYPEKAKIQIKECKKIKSKMALLEKSKANINRELASLSDDHQHKRSPKADFTEKKKKKKHPQPQ